MPGAWALRIDPLVVHRHLSRVKCQAGNSTIGVRPLGRSASADAADVGTRTNPAIIATAARAPVRRLEHSNVFTARPLPARSHSPSAAELYCVEWGTPAHRRCSSLLAFK